MKFSDQLVKAVAMFLCLLLAQIGAGEAFAYGFAIQAGALGSDPGAVYLDSIHRDDAVIAATVDTGVVDAVGIEGASGRAWGSINLANNGSVPVMKAFASVSGPYGAGVTMFYDELFFDFRWADPAKVDAIPLTIFVDFDAHFQGTSGAYPYGIFTYQFNEIGRSFDLGCTTCTLNLHNSYPYLLQPGITSIYSAIAFSVNVGSCCLLDGGSIDASHTAGFFLQLPEGVIYRSSLGEITTTAVPEPDTISLLGFALVSLVLWRRVHSGQTT